MTRLAALYADQRQYALAERTLQRAVIIREERLGRDPGLRRSACTAGGGGERPGTP
ncbi:MAG: tetratricopeptide repeat protein [Zoogloea sp.]|nr:tetratricopeptide repeat protein [Zoogloea sp.]